MRLVVLLLIGLTVLCQAQESTPMELRVVQLVNDYRYKKGLPAVTPDPELAKIARSHSDDMVRLKFFSHISPIEGKRLPDDRARRAGYSRPVSENLCVVPLSAKDPGAVAFEYWRKSDAHASNMIGSRHKWIGVGAVRGSNGYYFTQLFASEDRKDGDEGGAKINVTFNMKAGKALPPASLNTDLPYTEEDKRLAGLLVRARMNHSFPIDQAHDYRNARAFLYLAEHPELYSERVSSDALKTLGGLYSHNPTAKARFSKPGVGTVSIQRLPIDKNLKRVLAAALTSKHKEIRDTAYMVLSISFGRSKMDPAFEKVLASSVRTENGPEKEHALLALSQLKQRSELRDEVVLEALKGEDQRLALTALMAYATEADISPVKRKELLTEGLRLYRHTEPGIRAAALEFIGRVARTESEKASLRQALDRALFDTAPGVRERAAFAVGRHDGVGSIVHLVRLSADMADTKDFAYLDVVKTSLVGLDRVGDQALRTLHKLTKNLPRVQPFQYKLIDSKSGTPTQRESQLIVSESARAQEWLRSQKSKLPTQYP